MKMRLKISTKLLVGFLTILSLVATIGLYVFSSSRNSLEEVAGEGSVFLVEDTLQRIDKIMFLKLEEIERFTADSLLQEELKVSNDAFRALPDPDGYIETQDAKWIAAVESEEPTEFMESRTLNPLAERLDNVFIKFGERKYGHKTFGDVIVTNRFGAVVAATHNPEDYFQADETWWEGANEDVFVISGFKHYERSDTWGVALSLKITDGEGNFMGVIQALVPVEVIAWEIEQAGEKYESTELMLVTDDRSVIYHSHDFEFMTDISHKEFFEKVTHGESGFFVEHDNMREKLFSYAHSEGFHNYDGLGWVLVMSHDAEELFLPMLHMRNILLTVFSVLLLGIAAFAFLLSNSISKPIERLTKVSEKITAGDLNAKVDISSKDELGKLADTFNQMTTKLQQEISQHKIAEEKLSKINDLRRKFLTIIAHQLRTPLSASRVNLEMLLLGDAGKVTEKQLGLIEASHQTIKETIKRVGDLLQVVDIEEGKISLHKEEAPLQELVQSITDNYSNLAKVKKIKLKFKPASDLPKINFDLEKITVVINKLIENAIAYTPSKGSVDITLKKNGDQLRFSVVDTGIGIPKAEQSKVFEHFFRASNAMNVVTDASGVGLAVAKFFVEKHGGQIGFESKEKKGSTFWFELPIKEVSD